MSRVKRNSNVEACTGVKRHWDDSVGVCKKLSTMHAMKFADCWIWYVESYLQSCTNDPLGGDEASLYPWLGLGNIEKQCDMRYCTAISILNMISYLVRKILIADDNSSQITHITWFQNEQTKLLGVKCWRSMQCQIPSPVQLPSHEIQKFLDIG